MRLLPRQEKFFVYFNRHIECILEASRLLREGMDGGLEALRRAEPQIRELENKADQLVGEVVEKLGLTFITPIDPEDIYSLTSRLDDVIDYLEEASHRIIGFGIDEVTPAMKTLARLIDESVHALQKAFLALENGTSLRAQCLEVYRIEEAADQVERAAIAELFANERDPIRLLKFKELYEMLELVTDACEDVVDHLQNVVVKNS